MAPTSGTESPYHKPEDTAEKLDYEGMARVANYLSEATLYLSTRPPLSELTGVEEGEEPGSSVKSFRLGLRLNTGSSHHNYRDQYYTGKDIFAAPAGLMTNISSSQNFHLQPEAFTKPKGSEHNDGVLRTHTLTTPSTCCL